MSVETGEYIAMLRRMIAAGGKRLAIADEDELGDFVALHQVLEEAIQQGVDGQRASGSSWAQIGRGVGTTRQAAQMRWGKREEVAS